MLLDGGAGDLKFIALGICDFYVLWSSSVITYLVSVWQAKCTIIQETKVYKVKTMF